MAVMKGLRFARVLLPGRESDQLLNPQIEGGTYVCECASYGDNVQELGRLAKKFVASSRRHGYREQYSASKQGTFFMINTFVYQRQVSFALYLVNVRFRPKLLDMTILFCSYINFQLS